MKELRQLNQPLYDSLSNHDLLEDVEEAIQEIEEKYPLRNVKTLGQLLSSITKEDMDLETAGKIYYLAGIFGKDEGRLKKTAGEALSELTKDEKTFSVGDITFNRISLKERAYNGSPEVDELEQEIILAQEKLDALKARRAQALEESGFTHEQEKTFYYRYK